MKRLTDVLGQFLQTDETIRLGPHLGGKAPAVTEQQLTFLIAQLRAASAQNGKIIAVVIALYVAMLAGGFVIVFALLHEPKTMRTVLGGSFLSLLAIVKGLHSLWRENTRIQLMIALLPSLSPEDAIKVVESYYYKQKNVAQSRERPG
jgi:hypothetical protein